MASTSLDVAVVGAGPVAWAAAYALQRAGLSVGVVGPVGGGGRWSAVLPRGAAFLASLGLDPLQPAVGGMPVQGLGLVEGTHLAKADSSETRHPYIAVATDTGALARCAAQRWQGPRWESKASHLSGTIGGRTIDLEDGTTLFAKRVVAADGAEGAIAEALGGPLRGPRARQATASWIARHANPHQGWAFEASNDHGPVATTPMPDDVDGAHRSAVVWVDRIDSTTLHDPHAAAAALERLLGAQLGAVQAPENLHPWPARFAARRRWGPDWIALGEAARVWPPTGAQGLNQGLTAAQELGRIGDAFLEQGGIARWALRTETVAAARLAFVAGLHGALSFPLGPLRATGLQAWERCGPVRRAALRVGLS